MQCDAELVVLLCLMCSGNQVGVEGARALGDALKVNSTLTTLVLDSMLQYVACVMHVVCFAEC